LNKTVSISPVINLDTGNDPYRTVSVCPPFYAVQSKMTLIF